MLSTGINGMPQKPAHKNTQMMTYYLKFILISKAFILAFMLAFLLAPSVAFGTVYYVDKTLGSDSNDGLSGDDEGGGVGPWETITKVNATVSGTGDDVYFKCGETWQERLIIDWTGTSGDHAIIGSYYMDGSETLGVNGDGRPVFDGNSFTVPTYQSYQAMIDVNDEDYLEIKNIKIYQSGAEGINLTYSNYSLVDNCYVSQTVRQGILLVRCHDTDVTHCFVEYSGYDADSLGAGIEATGQDLVDSSYNITISECEVSNCYSEGIGLYKKTKDSTITKCTAWDNWSVNLYSGAGDNNTFSYNYVYYTATPRGYVRRGGIGIDNEAKRAYCAGDNHTIIGNFIAGCGIGITIAQNYNLVDPDCDWDGVLVEQNTIVDCTNYNMRIYYTEQAGATDWNIHFENNLSVIESGGGSHIYPCDPSPTNITFNNNFWDSDPGTGKCDDFDDPANADPLLDDDGIDWQNLSDGNEDGSAFGLTATSPAISTGTDRGTRNGVDLTNSDYSSSPVSVSVVDLDTYGWPHGAAANVMQVTNRNPDDGATGVALNHILTWSNPADLVSYDMYFDTTDGRTSLVVDDGTSESYNPQGEMSPSTTYYWSIDVTHAGGVQTGTVFDFTTVANDPPPVIPPSGSHGPGLSWQYSPYGITIKRQ